jgi:soluble lytic murein transglycosylase-like protein
MPKTIPPAIELALLDAAQKTGVPGNLALRLAYTESRYNPAAVSSAGARGLLQLMPHTGKAYGLLTEADFFNPEKNALAGLQYLRKLHKRFGKWWLAVAAYNRGPGWVLKNPDHHTWPPRLKEYVMNVFGERPGNVGPKGRDLAVPVYDQRGNKLSS